METLSQESENKQFQDRLFTDLSESINPVTGVFGVYYDELKSNNISKEVFKGFLENFLLSKDLDPYDIHGTYAKGGNIVIRFFDETEITMGFDDILEHKLDEFLEDRSIEEIETKVFGLNNAIESIFSDNDKLWGFEINDEDIVKTGEHKGKTLSELKELLEIENNLLAHVYDVSWEAKKKESLLKKELQFFAGIGDKYEGGARYFALSSVEVQKKVERLISEMTLQEIYTYLIDIHAQIDDNYKKSDMVKQVNLKLINQLYEQTFIKIKKESASIDDIIDFIKVLTGRGHSVENEDGTIDYEDLDFDEEFRDVTIANKVIIFAMTKEEGVIDDIIQENNGIESIEIEDEALKGRTPSQLLGEAKNKFGEMIDGQGITWTDFLGNIGMGLLKGKESFSYVDLSLEEKVQLGGMARILDYLSDLPVDIETATPEVLFDGIISSIPKLLGESFKAVNESLGENFDALWGVSGKSASDIGLSGKRAELFDLYQDINGNQFWDLSDTAWFNNITASGSITVLASMALAAIAIGMLPATAGILAISAAGAAAGGLTGFTTQLIGRQGYDSASEAMWDTGSVVAADAAVGAVFLLSSVKFFKKFGINILSAKFFTKASAGDAIGFGGTEAAFNGILLAPIVSKSVKNNHDENHFDTDGKKI